MDHADKERTHFKKNPNNRQYTQQGRRRQPWGPSHMPPHSINRASAKGPQNTTLQTRVPYLVPLPLHPLLFLWAQRQQLNYQLAHAPLRQSDRSEVINPV